MNRKQKGGIILSSLAAIAIAGSLIAGSTYALFTSESKANIAITSGKVNVSATIENWLTYTGKELTGVVKDDAEKIKPSTEYDLKNGEFMNGGTAELVDNTLTLDLVTPGDKVTFDIRIHNDSDVAAMYRTAITIDDNGLFDGLEVSVGGVSLTSQSRRTTYKELKVESDDEIINCSVMLPTDAGNEYQGSKCSISYTVEAIQGNAFNGVYDVTPDTVQAALDNATDGDTIILGEGSYETLYFRQSAKSSVYDSGETSTYSTLHIDGSKVTYDYHPGRTDVTYLRTLKDITIVGSEGATVKNIEFMDDMYNYAEDGDGISGNIIYSDKNPRTEATGDADPANKLISFFNISNLMFQDINFTGEVTPLKLSHYARDNGFTDAFIYPRKIDGLHFDGCSMTAGEGNAKAEMLLEVVVFGTNTKYKNVSISNCEVAGAGRLVKADGIENVSISRNTMKNLTKHNILLSQGSNCAPVTGKVVITKNRSDNSQDRVIRIGNAKQMNLYITNNVVTDYDQAENDAYIKVAGAPLSKVVSGNVATNKDPTKTCTIEFN